MNIFRESQRTEYHIPFFVWKITAFWTPIECLMKFISIAAYAYVCRTYNCVHMQILGMTIYLQFKYLSNIFLTF